MAEEDRAMWAREARKLDNKIAFRLKTIEDAQKDLPKLVARRDELLKKIAEAYDEEHGL